MASLLIVKSSRVCAGLAKLRYSENNKKSDYFDLQVNRICGFTRKRHWKLRVKDLPKVPTWRIERVSNPRSFGRKASTLPKRHHAPRPMSSRQPPDKNVLSG